MLPRCALTAPESRTRLPYMLVLLIVSCCLAQCDVSAYGNTAFIVWVPMLLVWDNKYAGMPVFAAQAGMSVAADGTMSVLHAALGRQHRGRAAANSDVQPGREAAEAGASRCPIVTCPAAAVPAAGLRQSPCCERGAPHALRVLAHG